MLFDTHSTQTAEASLDALWLQAQVISNNMANVDTPGFKASSVSFGEVLAGAVERGRGGGDGGDGGDAGRARGEGRPTYRTSIIARPDLSVRVDNNNVQLEKEQTELGKTYAQYSYLLDRVGGYYNNIQTAITTMRG